MKTRLRIFGRCLVLTAIFAAALGATRAQTVLHGGGATFPAPVYKRWFDSYKKQHPNVQVEYDAVGSEEGIRLLAEAKVDFAGSDMPLSDEMLSQLGRKAMHIATVLGGVVPIYNLSGLERDLRFTPETLAAIYLGKIKKWNDPAIRAVNHSAALPDRKIVVVHRSDGSGTTFVWTEYLSKVSAGWKSRAGSGVTVNWPTGVGAPGNEGVATAVEKTPNAIGYVEFIYAIQHQLTFGAVGNSAGQFVQANLSSVTAAAEDVSFDKSSDFRISITNAPGKHAYPIASFTWLLVPEQSDDPKARAALLDILHWLLTSGQKQCSALGYPPLPPAVAESELRALDTLK